MGIFASPVNAGGTYGGVEPIDCGDGTTAFRQIGSNTNPCMYRYLHGNSMPVANNRVPAPVIPGQVRPVAAPCGCMKYCPFNLRVLFEMPHCCLVAMPCVRAPVDPCKFNSKAQLACCALFPNSRDCGCPPAWCSRTPEKIMSEEQKKIAC